MIFKKLKKHIPDKQEIVNQSGIFKKYLRNPHLWQFNRETIARGMAAGLSAAMIPFMPFQTIIAIVLGILLRGNLFIAFIASWASNPLTIVPIIYLIYSVGGWLLGEKQTKFTQFGEAFFIGLPIVAVCAGFIGYVAVRLVWQCRSFFK